MKLYPWWILWSNLKTMREKGMDPIDSVLICKEELFTNSIS